uniref:DNA/RNA-binding protein Alba-like domain-containing protein n=1 Tax=Timema genevievae TaxID=629358 RepID=A0A7R9JR14_TIMGE|nr:unnamed protein product [Timema genevievae]
MSVKRRTDVLLKVNVVVLVSLFPPKCGSFDVRCGGSCRDVALMHAPHTGVENYSKGKNVEEALSKENIPIPDLPDNFVWMQDRDWLEVSHDMDWMEVFQDRDCMAVSQDMYWMEVFQDRDWMEVSQDMYWMEVSQDMDWMEVSQGMDWMEDMDWMEVFQDRDWMEVSQDMYWMEVSQDMYWMEVFQDRDCMAVSQDMYWMEVFQDMYWMEVFQDMYWMEVSLDMYWMEVFQDMYWMEVSQDMDWMEVFQDMYWMEVSQDMYWMEVFQDMYWMECTICPQVGAGSKMRSVLGFAMKSFKDERCIVWSGSGPAISKTISCAEIMKRRYKNTHQITKIGYRKVEEFWEPQIEDLDPLVVVREIPIIHILLSKDELNSEEPGYVHVLESVAVEDSKPSRDNGTIFYSEPLSASYSAPWCSGQYQPPGNTDVFWRAKENTPDSRRGTGKKLNKSPRVSEEQFAALGLRKGPKRAHRNPGGGGEHGKAQKGAAAGGEGSDVQDV